MRQLFTALAAALSLSAPHTSGLQPRKAYGRIRAVTTAHAAKRARKAADIVGRKASKRFYRAHRAAFVDLVKA